MMCHKRFFNEAKTEKWLWPLRSNFAYLICIFIIRNKGLLSKLPREIWFLAFVPLWRNYTISLEPVLNSTGHILSKNMGLNA